MRLLALAIALAACKQDAKPAPAAAPSTIAAPSVAVDTSIVVDAPIAIAPSVPALPVCPPSAYRNDGWSIGGLIPFVFPGCPPPELELDVAFCAACARPCGYTRMTAIDGEAGSSSSVSATYDAAGRIVALSTDPLDQRFTYDAQGRLIAWQQLASTYAIERDAADHITRITKHPPPPDEPASWTFHYDAAGRVVDTVDPYGSKLGFFYDAAGRQVAEDDAGDRAEFRYDASGRLIYRGTNWKDTLAYDARGRLTTIASGSTRKRTDLTYEGDRLARVVITGEDGRAVTTTTYDYDCAP